MAELCAKPVAKGDNLLSQDHITLNTSGGAAEGSQVAPQPKSGGAGLGRLGVSWLVVTTLIAIASLVMAAWATSKLQRTTPIVLVANLQQARDRGWTTLGSLYTGSGYWANSSMKMVHPRSDHGVVAHRGRIYVFGGTSFDANGTAQVLRNMTRYNMYNGTYTEMQAMPDPRYRFGYAILNDKLYVFGGFNIREDAPRADDNVPYYPVATTMVFDLVTERWSPIDPAMSMTVARADLAGAAAGGKVFSMGGYEDVAVTYKPSACVEVLDPAVGRWTRIADLPTPRGDLSAQAVDGVVYTIGGVETLNFTYAWTGAVEAYDTASSKWTRRSSMAYARGDLATEALSNGNILAAGGEGSFTFGFNAQDNRGNTVARPWVEEYIPSMDIWVTKASLFEPRFRFDMASHDGEVAFAFGGAASCNDASLNQDESCHRQALSSILGYHDVPLPNIFAAMT